MEKGVPQPSSVLSTENLSLQRPGNASRQGERGHSKVRNLGSLLTEPGWLEARTISLHGPPPKDSSEGQP